MNLATVLGMKNSTKGKIKQSRKRLYSVETYFSGEQNQMPILTMVTKTFYKDIFL